MAAEMESGDIIEMIPEESQSQIDVLGISAAKEPKYPSPAVNSVARQGTFGQVFAGDLSKTSSQRVRKTPISDNKGDGIFITKHKLTQDNLDKAFPQTN